MRIALIKPCWRYPITQRENTYNRVWPPLELLTGAAIFRDAGFDVSVIDAQAMRLTPQQVANEASGADLAILTTSALDRWQCPPLEIGPIREICHTLRDSVGRLAVTGFHGTFAPERMLRETGADILIRGEPEPVMFDLAASRPLESIGGISRLVDSEVIHGGDARPTNLAALPVPAYDLIDPRNYDYEVLGRRFALLEGSRGCRFQCDFCAKDLMVGRGIRYKPVERVLEEVDAAIAAGFRSAYLFDLEWAADREHAEATAEGLIRRGTPLRWCCQTRADMVDPELLSLMRRAGCRLVHFGTETGSERLAKMMGKAIDPSRQVEAVAMARRAGLDTLCFFLLGHPDETEEEMVETIEFAKRLNPTYVSFHRLTSYPSSRLFERHRLEAVDSDQDESDDRLFPEFIGDPKRQELVDQMVRRGIMSFYLRPSYILGRLLRGNPGQWLRQFRLFWGYVKQ